MDAKRHSCAAVWPLLLLAMCIGVCRAHVALTFPPARQPAWDFLDSGRTPPPCGVPKGNHFTNKHFLLLIGTQKKQTTRPTDHSIKYERKQPLLL